jgi:hypothetical protein
VVDLGTGKTRQLTSGTHHEHSIAWSPDGKEIAFISNREENEDQFFNYDLFVLDPSNGKIRRITATESAEYKPLAITNAVRGAFGRKHTSQGARLIFADHFSCSCWGMTRFSSIVGRLA